MKKSKGIKKSNRVAAVSNPITYVKNIKEVHIVSNGIFTICKVTFISDSVAYYNWDKKEDRDFIRKSVTSDANIVVDKNVTKGWNYD